MKGVIKLKRMDVKTDQVFIPANRIRIFLVAVSSFMLSGLSVYIWNISGKIKIATSLDLKFISGFLIVGLFTAGAYSFEQYFNPRSGVFLSKEGITDNSSGFSLGFISSKDISEIELVRFMSQKMIIIKVVNPEVYLSKAGALNKFFLDKMYEKFRTPVVISTKSLNCDLGELLNKLGTWYPGKMKEVSIGSGEPSTDR